jgi:hypothetical protein
MGMEKEAGLRILIRLTPVLGMKLGSMGSKPSSQQSNGKGHLSGKPTSM